jgi:hypothetical protein
MNNTIRIETSSFFITSLQSQNVSVNVAEYYESQGISPHTVFIVLAARNASTDYKRRITYTPCPDCDNLMRTAAIYLRSPQLKEVRIKDFR